MSVTLTYFEVGANLLSGKFGRVGNTSLSEVNKSEAPAIAKRRQAVPIMFP